MRAAVLRFPNRQTLRAVLEQPRRSGSDAVRRPRRDPLLYVVLVVNLVTWLGLGLFYLALFQ